MDELTKQAAPLRQQSSALKRAILQASLSEDCELTNALARLLPEEFHRTELTEKRMGLTEITNLFCQINKERQIVTIYHIRCVNDNKVDELKKFFEQYLGEFSLSRRDKFSPDQYIVKFNLKDRNKVLENLKSAKPSKASALAPGNK